MCGHGLTIRPPANVVFLLRVARVRKKQRRTDDRMGHNLSLPRASGNSH